MRGLAILLLALWSGWAQAQTVGIRSGEHDGFTRLVFYFEAPSEWSLGRAEDGFLLRVDTPDARFDTSQVFDRIGKERVSALAPETSGALRLQVTCDCHATAFTVAPQIIAVDIRDGPAPPGNRFEARIDTPPEPEIAGLEEAEPAPPPAPSVVLPIVTPIRAEPSVPFVAPPPRVGPEPHEDPSMATLQSELVQEVARAASQGLLTPVVPPAGMPPPVDFAALETRDQMAVASSIDRALWVLGPDTAMTDDGGPCIPDAQLDIAAWAPDPPDYSVVAEQRANILDARDLVKSEAAIALAKTYLNMGFGAEARQVITAFAADHPDAEFLTGLSNILDETRSSQRATLAQQASCPSRVAMWSALATDAPADLINLDTAAVVVTYSALPVHLRRHLGPRLSDRFLSIGNDAAARQIRDALARAPGDHGSGSSMMDADLADASGDPSAAEERLRAVVEAGGPGAAGALVRLMTLLERLDRAPGPPLTDLAAAYAFEHRGTTIGDQLTAATVYGHARGGAFEAGLETLRRARWSESAPPDAARRAADTLFERLAKSAPDAEFLRVSFMAPDLAFSIKAFGAARRAMAERLVTIGLPERAAELLDTDTQTEEDRMILARVDLAAGRPEDALARIESLVTPAARRVAAQARAAMEDFGTAAKLYEELDEPEAGASAAWRAGDWARVQNLGNPTQRDIARLYLSRNSGEEPAQARDPMEVSLTASQAALAQSASTRGKLEELLAEIQSPSIDR